MSPNSEMNKWHVGLSGVGLVALLWNQIKWNLQAFPLVSKTKAYHSIVPEWPSLQQIPLNILYKSLPCSCCLPAIQEYIHSSFWSLWDYSLGASLSLTNTLLLYWVTSVIKKNEPKSTTSQKYNFLFPAWTTAWLFLFVGIIFIATEHEKKSF